MKKIIFGGFCMLTGMLLFILLHLWDVTPSHHDFGIPMVILALLITLGGFGLGLSGLKKD